MESSGAQMPVSQQMDRQTFLAHLSQSGLLSAELLAAVLPRLPVDERGRAAARALVEWKLLTRFQAESLLVGRSQGFLIGPYRILDQMGRDDLGRLYKAEHLTMHRVVALKIL